MKSREEVFYKLISNLIEEEEKHNNIKVEVKYLKKILQMVDVIEEHQVFVVESEEKNGLRDGYSGKRCSG